MTAGFAAAARAEDMTASVFTINNQSSMQFWIDQGVTAMETDFPEVLINLLASQPSADLDDDGDVDGADWAIYNGGLHSTQPGVTDLTGDGMNNHADFVLFKKLYENANGFGSFEIMPAGVPEPASFGLMVLGGLAFVFSRRKSY